MANHKATKKDVRQAAKRRDRNRYYGKTTRNAIRDIKTLNDKSAFLEKLGFTSNNYNELIEEIIFIATHNEATLSKNSIYGSLYKVEGQLKNKAVITIWLEKMETDQFIFITLYPNL